MAKFLKSVEDSSNGFIKQKELVIGTNFDSSNKTILSGSTLQFTYADRTDTTSRLGNLFATFNLPITNLQKAEYISGGTYYNTAFRDLNQDNIIFINIPKNEYGELILGNSINLTLPIVSGGTDVPIEIRSVYFENNTSNRLRMDKPMNDNSIASEIITESAIHGSTVKVSSTEESNIVYLFSDAIAPPISGGSWSTGTTYNNDSSNPITPRTMAKFSTTTNTFDTPVGIAYLDKGFIALTHPDIVNNFSLTAATNYTGQTEGLYFNNSTSAITSFKSYKTEFIQTIICTALPGEFYKTTNPTYTPEMEENGDPVMITGIALFNEDNELIGIAKPSAPIIKTKQGYFSVTINVKL
jgi:hypothetical protein